MGSAYTFEVRENLRDAIYGQQWAVIRVNANGQGLQIGAYRTAVAAEHVAASLRWAEMIDRQNRDLRKGTCHRG